MASTNFKLKVPRHVVELLRGLHPQIKRKVKASMEILVSDPRSGKALKEELAGLWSFRAGRFRIIYRLPDNKIIEIVAVGPREAIYEETAKLLRGA